MRKFLSLISVSIIILSMAGCRVIKADNADDETVAPDTSEYTIAPEYADDISTTEAPQDVTLSYSDDNFSLSVTVPGNYVTNDSASPNEEYAEDCAIPTVLTFAPDEYPDSVYEFGVYKKSEMMPEKADEETATLSNGQIVTIYRTATTDKARIIIVFPDIDDEYCVAAWADTDSVVWDTYKTDVLRILGTATYNINQ